MSEPCRCRAIVVRPLGEDQQIKIGIGSRSAARPRAKQCKSPQIRSAANPDSDCIDERSCLGRRHGRPSCISMSYDVGCENPGWQVSATTTKPCLPNSAMLLV